MKYFNFHDLFVSGVGLCEFHEFRYSSVEYFQNGFRDSGVEFYEFHFFLWFWLGIIKFS